jgi:hypothetical protein
MTYKNLAGLAKRYSDSPEDHNVVGLVGVRQISNLLQTVATVAEIISLDSLHFRRKLDRIM